MLKGKQVLLIISGGIAAYKSLELIRQLREQDVVVHSILTSSATEFVTPLSVSALSENKVYTDLFSLTDEIEMGHIQLSRNADIVLVAPATANILAKMTQGVADDLATTVLLATDKDVVVAPAMNVRMWRHAATQQNIKNLQSRGIIFSGPVEGKMACGEFGMGRLIDTSSILNELENYFGKKEPLTGLRALVTSGPTHESIDPVRYIGNRSSGKQGNAIAAALFKKGVKTTLITGPSNEPIPLGVNVIEVQSAKEMHAATMNSLPVDIAICAAAVADWRPSTIKKTKIKKINRKKPPALELVKNPDILFELSTSAKNRPHLVVGFAAETENLIQNASAKRLTKTCDWIIANDISTETKNMGGEDNTVHLISGNGIEDWPRMTKVEIANKIAERISEHFKAFSAPLK
tara:strand:- start:464 stop:1684 length:1221 start_codon:yes stop_codon:yes gene_type:complete